MRISEFLNSSAVDQPFYVLFGRPVAHSLSPLIHNHALNYHKLRGNYYAVLVNPDEEFLIPGVLSHENFRGANVTIPLKQSVRDFLDDESEMSTKVGAVNTILIRNGKISGYNTDVDGFLKPLLQYEDRLKNQQAMVFGSGGAARASVYGLQKLEMKTVYVVSRTPENIDASAWSDNEQIQFISYEQIPDYIAASTILVNTTPLGMEPNIEGSPILRDLESKLSNKICYDIVYKPLHTKFLKQAQAAGSDVIDGLEMFVGQAAVSFKLWTGYPFPVQDTRKLILNKIR